MTLSILGPSITFSVLPNCVTVTVSCVMCDITLHFCPSPKIIKKKETQK